MGHAAGGGDAGHEADEYDRQVRISHAHLQLVKDAAVQEHGEGMQEGAVAFAAHAGCPRAHILFGNAHRQITVGVGLTELLDLAGGTEIGRHHDNFRMLRCKAKHIFFMGIYFDFHFGTPPLHCIVDSLKLFTLSCADAHKVHGTGLLKRLDAGCAAGACDDDKRTALVRGFACFAEILDVVAVALYAG